MKPKALSLFISLSSVAVALFFTCSVAYGSSSLGYTILTQDNYKVIFLKNGMEVKGIVTQEDNMIKVVTKEGDVFYFSNEEIRRIEDPNEKINQQKQREERRQLLRDALEQKRLEMEQKALQKKENREANIARRKSLGGCYFLTTEIGSTITKLSSKYSRQASFSIINGYRARYWFQFGIGIDYSYLDYAHSVGSFLHFKFPFCSDKVISPYIYENVGVRNVFGYFNYYDNQLFLQSSSGVGLQFKLNQRNSISIGFDYTLHFTNVRMLHSLGLKLSYTFYKM